MMDPKGYTPPKADTDAIDGFTLKIVVGALKFAAAGATLLVVGLGWLLRKAVKPRALRWIGIAAGVVVGLLFLLASLFSQPIATAVVVVLASLAVLAVRRDWLAVKGSADAGADAGWAVVDPPGGPIRDPDFSDPDYSPEDAPAILAEIDPDGEFDNEIRRVITIPYKDGKPVTGTGTPPPPNPTPPAPPTQWSGWDED